MEQTEMYYMAHAQRFHNGMRQRVISVSEAEGASVLESVNSRAEDVEMGILPVFDNPVPPAEKRTQPQPTPKPAPRPKPPPRPRPTPSPPREAGPPLRRRLRLKSPNPRPPGFAPISTNPEDYAFLARPTRPKLYPSRHSGIVLPAATLQSHQPTHLPSIHTLLDVVISIPRPSSRRPSRRDSLHLSPSYAM